jgi:UDP-N-acetylmuramoyl-tripeptide--D-alanyl-D-alanine ligase
VTASYARLTTVPDVDPSLPLPPDAAGPGLSADELVSLTGGRLLSRSERSVRHAAVDSRLVEPGFLFVALPGERTDGHEHLDHAIARGAAAILVTRPIAATAADVTVIRVADGLEALAAVATGWRRRFHPVVIGVTGSIAKTSTKEAVAAVVGRRFTTLRSKGNRNNEVGLPLTVLDLGPEHEALVVEMGMYVGGEIADLARIARPSIGVVTAVQAVHLSRIGTLEAIEQAKGELLEALPPDGMAILNADDPIVRRMGARTAARALTYGFADDADVGAEDVSSNGLAGMTFTLRMPAGRRAARVPTLGRLSVHNALAAAAVGVAAGLTPDEIVDGLADGWSAPHRVQLVRAGEVVIIDDTYNASPGSVTAALQVLAELPGRRIAVLGEMLELGEGHEDGHRVVGEAAAQTVDRLVVIGEEASAIADGAISAGLDPSRVVVVPDAEAALDHLRSRLRDGDVVLVKASRGIALESLVDALRAELGPAA